MKNSKFLFLVLLSTFLFSCKKEVPIKEGSNCTTVKKKIIIEVVEEYKAYYVVYFNNGKQMSVNSYTYQMFNVGDEYCY